ncbi:MAG: DUF2177 family protein [Candidatus Saccharibacteria bacterium]
MLKILGSFLVVISTLVLIDGFWLGLIAPNFYKKHIGHLMATNPTWAAAGLFYVVFIAGLLYFVVRPLGVDASLLKIFLSGALFGLATYATYDLTNQATLKDWPIIVTIVDLAWGTFLTASVSTVSVVVLRFLGWV